MKFKAVKRGWRLLIIGRLGGREIQLGQTQLISLMVVDG